MQKIHLQCGQCGKPVSKPPLDPKKVVLTLCIACWRKQVKRLHEPPR